jgi:hypothetical protein
VSQNWGTEVTVEDLYNSLKVNPPNKRQLAKAYKDDGYKPKDIMEFMGCTLYDARYYVSNPPKVEYRNMYWYTRFELKGKVSTTNERVVENTQNGVFFTTDYSQHLEEN